MHTAVVTALLCDGNQAETGLGFVLHFLEGQHCLLAHQDGRGGGLFDLIEEIPGLLKCLDADIACCGCGGNHAKAVVTAPRINKACVGGGAPVCLLKGPRWTKQLQR